MKKVFEFGKIDFYGMGRKINKVTVEIELEEALKQKFGGVNANKYDEQ